MIRSALRQVSAAAVMSWTWRHRGSAVRSVDLLVRLPDRVRRGQVGEVITEAKAIGRLDHAFPTDLAVRLQALSDGQITMRQGLDADDLAVVRRLLAPIAGIVDVRTDVAHQPTLDSALAS
jgi:hypothetical protein